MRAAVFSEGGKPWTIETLPDPEPSFGEAVIKVGRCGICGSDISMTTEMGGDYPCNAVLGHEFAGEIVALGRGIESLRMGDRVTAMPCAGCGACEMCRAGMQALCPNINIYLGGFGQYMRIAERTAFRLPSALSLADGALVEPLAVGLHGVAMARLRPGSRVLVLGSGTVGLTTAFWARRLGAGRIVSASRSARRADAALAMGADAFVLTGEGELDRVKAALGGPPEYVFETAGAVGLLGKAIDHVAPNGEIISLGYCMSADPVVPRLATIKQATIRFSMTWTPSDFRHAVDILDRGHVEPREMLSNLIGLDALPAKVEELRGQHGEIKVHVDPWR